MLAVLLTPPGRGALAVIHVAGEGARARVERLFAGRIDAALRPGRLVDRGETVDEVMVRTVEGFTAEETVEITSHGGPAVVDRIFAALDVPRAHPVELLERGVATGRLDRLQAEAWTLLPQALTERAAAMLHAQAQGALSEAVRALRGPADVERLLSTAAAGSALVSPRRVVLAGPPNAGKSSLFNALVERDRALVSPVPGTTRDPVREVIAIDGLPIELVDTAGVDEPRGPIEAAALDRTRAAVAAADLLLVVQDLETGARVGFNVAPLVVANKADLGRSSPWPDALPVSAKTGQGLDELRRRIVKALGVEGLPDEGAPVVFTSRQERLLRSSGALAEVQAALLR